ncbi:MAG: glycosyl hydrolase, partial [Saprospiraceae bacterium]|nr:glycosyl hydrolase [Saprospiraceae bacterium]
GDNHDLWFHPSNPLVIINGNDGGANVSYNGGFTWSSQRNQPTAQFYRVNADDRFPFYVYGGQQDNSTVAVPSAWTGNGIPYGEFYSVGGCESAYTAFDPADPRYVYAGCYQGIITKYDTELKVSKDIMAYPDLGLGQKPATMKYRFNWNAPILLSQHDGEVLFHAGNQLLKSTDGGLSWEEVSPDLTRNTADKLDYGGGPITNEAAGGENYHTIMYLAESPHDRDVLWVGTDDGLIHITQDGGSNWLAVSPPSMQEGIVNCIDLSTSQPGKAYVAFTRYKFNDFTPHIFITEDFGKTWRRSVEGIPQGHHVRVVRHDPHRPGLLYAGTEAGLYISLDDGSQWSLFQRNLPVVPITDLKVHHDGLIASTQGRAFWILDDLTPLREWNHQDLELVKIFQPRDACLWGGRRVDTLLDQGTNPDYGLVAYYHVPESDDSSLVQVSILNQDGIALRTFSTRAKKAAMKLQVHQGLNKLVWNLRPDPPEAIEGVMTQRNNLRPRVSPGQYELQLMINEDTFTRKFKVMGDPRLVTKAEDEVAKADLLQSLDEAYQELVVTVKNMSYVKNQINQLIERNEFANDSMFQQAAKTIVASLDSLDARLVQRQQKTFQDVINYPNQLHAKIRHIQNLIDRSPPPLTAGQRNRVTVLLEEWERFGKEWDKLTAEIDVVNEEVRRMAIPFISTARPKQKVIKP